MVRKGVDVGNIIIQRGMFDVEKKGSISTNKTVNYIIIFHI